MKIADLRLTGLAGVTVEGGWANELTPDDNLHTIVEVITDDGLVGVGSAMTSKALVDASVKLLRPLLLNERADEPARVTEKLRQHTFWQGRGGAVEHAISGIDIALWDLAGKLTGLPIATLLGGPFRDSIRMYSHGVGVDMNDKASCRAFADRVRSMPEGFNAFKCSIDQPLGVPSARFTPTLDQAQLRVVARAFNNMREALGEANEVAVHCHDEFDEPSAVGIGKAVESMNPLFIEPAPGTNVIYSVEVLLGHEWVLVKFLLPSHAPRVLTAA